MLLPSHTFLSPLLQGKALPSLLALERDFFPFAPPFLFWEAAALVVGPSLLPEMEGVGVAPRKREEVGPKMEQGMEREDGSRGDADVSDP